MGVSRLIRSAPMLALAALGCSPSQGDATREPEKATTSGWIVWESNRSGAYRIWISDLDGRGLRKLSTDEPGRNHCCARIAPDGERVAYLSMPAYPSGYLLPTATGELRLAPAAGGAERTLSTTARHLGEHRGLVWWSAGELTYLEADGTTRKLDLALGGSEILLRSPPEESGWLVSPGGLCATTAQVTFSELNPATGQLTAATELGGCEPTFSADGELGLWVAGPGGPIDVIDLDTRETRTLVAKDDPRLPEGRRYLYFPSLSADRSLLVYGASGGQHDHTRADYDIFVVELDPERVILAGTPQPIAPHPGVDRYPDIWRPAAPREQRRRKAPRALPPPATPPPTFVWNLATDANRRAPGTASELLESNGATWTDRHGRLALAGGHFAATATTAKRVAAALTATNALSLAAFIQPASLAEEPQPIVSLSRSPRQRGFVLRQNGQRLELMLRTDKHGRAEPPIPLARLPDAEAHHVALSFSPGRMAIYLDGQIVERRIVAGHFFHWRIEHLQLGAEPGRRERFRGHLSHLGIWNRELAAEEIADLAAAVRAHFAADPPVARHVAVTRLVARSEVPTLESISPYRRALTLEEHELVRALSGELPPRFRVARWALLDGEPTGAMRLPLGSEAQLLLEPYDDQPQLESVVLADTLPKSPVPLFVAVGVDDR